MTIEVRQLLIRSTVDSTCQSTDGQADRTGESCPRVVEWALQFRQELLAECKRWLDRRLNELSER